MCKKNNLYYIFILYKITIHRARVQGKYFSDKTIELMGIDFSYLSMYPGHATGSEFRPAKRRISGLFLDKHALGGRPMRLPGIYTHVGFRRGHAPGRIRS